MRGGRRKAERFIQTGLRECAHAQPHQSPRERTEAMPAWIDTGNVTRPHSDDKGIPPCLRLNNLLGFDS